MMAVGLKLDLVRFWSSGLVEMSMFSWDFEVDSWLRFWRWNLSKLCVRTHDMTSRSYFGKMNSTLGSVVPLAMFRLVVSFGFPRTEGYAWYAAKEPKSQPSKKPSFRFLWTWTRVVTSTCFSMCQKIGEPNSFFYWHPLFSGGSWYHIAHVKNKKKAFL